MSRTELQAGADVNFDNDIVICGDTREFIYQSSGPLTDIADLKFDNKPSAHGYKEQESKGFILLENSLSCIQDMFVSGEIPPEGTALELVLVKKETKDNVGKVVLKLRPVENN